MILGLKIQSLGFRGDFDTLGLKIPLLLKKSREIYFLSYFPTLIFLFNHQDIGFPDFCNDCDIIVELRIIIPSFLLPSLFTLKKNIAWKW